MVLPWSPESPECTVTSPVELEPGLVALAEPELVPSALLRVLPVLPELSEESVELLPEPAEPE
jgi:hypothetical protein